MSNSDSTKTLVRQALFTLFLDCPVGWYTAEEIAEAASTDDHAVTTRQAAAAMRADRMGFNPLWVDATEDVRLVGPSLSATYRKRTIYRASREGIAAVLAEIS